MTATGVELAEIFDLEEQPDLTPHWNIAPTQNMAIIREPRKLAFARFGFVPSFARDPREGTKFINARAETVATQPAFRDAFRERRCLVIVDGFYEWSGEGKARQPFLIEQPDGKAFALAGVWSRWVSRETGEVIESCAIITKRAEGVVAELHNREPVCLPSSTWARWLAKDSEVSDLLAAKIDLVSRPVSKRVNSPKNDDAGCVDPPDER